MSDSRLLTKGEALFACLPKDACETWGSRSILRRECTHLELREKLSLFDLKFDGDPGQARVFVISESGDNILQIESLSNTKVIAIPIFTLSEVISVSSELTILSFANKLAEALERLSSQESKRYEALLNCCGDGARLSLVVRSELTKFVSGHVATGDFKITLIEEIGLAASLGVSFTPRIFRLVSK